MTNLIDIACGKLIRSRRKALGHTQQSLAAAIGCTFQQVQKYERGINRVSASRLYAIAKALDCPVSHFFPAEDEGSDLSRFMTTLDAQQLCVAYLDLPPVKRAAVLALMRVI